MSEATFFARFGHLIVLGEEMHLRFSLDSCVFFRADASECAKKTSPADPAPAADNKADLGG